MSFTNVNITKPLRVFRKDLSSNVIYDKKYLASFVWRKPQGIWQAILYKIKYAKFARKLLKGLWFSYLVRNEANYVGEEWYWSFMTDNKAPRPAYKKEFFDN